MPPSRRRRAPSGARETQSPPPAKGSGEPSSESSGASDGSDATPDHYTYQEMVDHLRKVRSSSSDQGLKSKKKRRRRSNQPIRAKRRRRYMMMGLGLLILLPILAFVAGSFLFSYLAYGGEKFRKEMSESVSESIGYQGEFEDPFKVSKLAVKNRKFSAAGPDDSVLAGFTLTNMEARLRFGSFLSKDWLISHLIADRAELQLRPLPPQVEGTTQVPLLDEAIKVLAAGLGFSGVPNSYDAERVSCRHFSAEFGINPDNPHRLDGLHLTMNKTNPGYFVTAGRGTLDYFYWPPFRIEAADFTWGADGMLSIHRANLTSEDGGTCSITGEIFLGSEPRVDLAIAVKNVKVSDMVHDDWSERLLGRLEGDLTLQGGLSMDDLPELKGKVKIPGLSVKGLEILSSLSLNFGTAELSRLAFDEFSATIHQKGGIIRLYDIYGSNPRAASLLGEFTVQPNHSISGKFEIGLPDDTLARATRDGITKGRPAFFKSKPDNPFGWTTFDVTGSLEAPTDNLDRLFDAHYRGDYNPREHRRTTTFQRPQALRNGATDIYLERLNQLFDRYVPTK